jgi:glycosyltransferase involved in cell wall biosynthesis
MDSMIAGSMRISSITPVLRTELSSRLPRLIVAGHFVQTGRVGGAEQMLYNLLRGLIANVVDTTLICGDERNISPAFLAEIATAQSLRILTAGGNSARFIAEQLACLRTDISADAVLFPNYYVPPITPRRLGRVGVVIHDFQYRHFPQYFSRKKRAWLHLSQSLTMRLADRVIVISDFVRRDAIRWFGERIADRIVVIPNALSWDRFETGPDRPRPLLRPYILSVAAQYPHKNLATLLRAFAIVARKDRDVQLVLCGQLYAQLHGVGGAGGDISGLIGELGLSDRVMQTGFVDDPTLADWYRHAEFFVFPSLFEGFGMPPVEALGLGLTVLTTRATAIPEVTMGLAQMVEDPLSVEEWADKLIALLAKPSAWRPSPSDVARLRDVYRPERIARSYLAALTE